MWFAPRNPPFEAGRAQVYFTNGGSRHGQNDNDNYNDDEDDDDGDEEEEEEEEGGAECR